MRTRMRTVVATAVAVIAVVGVLAGCATPPGAAAVVDGRTISQSYLEDAYTDLQGTGIDRSTLLQVLIAAPLVIDAAADNGVGVSEAEARALLEDGLETDRAIAAGTVEYLRFAMSVQNLAALPDGTDILVAVDEQVRDLSMTVNPRYGEVDPETGMIRLSTPPWIVSG